MFNVKRSTVALLASLSLTAGCANGGANAGNTLITTLGAGLGAISGGLLGSTIGDGTGQAVATATGSIVGGGVGAYAAQSYIDSNAQPIQAAAPQQFQVQPQAQIQQPQIQVQPTQTTVFQQPSQTVSSYTCLLYTSPSPRDATLSRMPSSA